MRDRAFDTIQSQENCFRDGVGEVMDFETM